MSDVKQDLVNALQARFGSSLTECRVAVGEVTVQVPARVVLEVCAALRDEPEFSFEQLIDLCGVDYQIGRAHV